jgi:protein-tyrosine phosphatase
MIDIHCHLLPGLDDGARTIEESVAMLDIAVASGVTDVVATPHANSEFAFCAESIRTKMAQLREHAKNRIRIHPGCDFHLSYDNVEDALRYPTKYTINNGCYLLVEFSDAGILHNSRNIFRTLRNVGIIPIVTHPERHAVLRKKLPDLESWIEDGCLLQVTAQSFLGAFGRSAQQCADTLLKRNMIHFVASDAHDTKRRPPRLNETYSYVCRKADRECADRLFIDNPRCAIEGQLIEMDEQFGIRRKRFYFWHRKRAS